MKINVGRHRMVALLLGHVIAHSAPGPVCEPLSYGRMVVAFGESQIVRTTIGGVVSPETTMGNAVNIV
jgi:hypothetical protein